MSSFPQPHITQVEVMVAMNDTSLFKRNIVEFGPTTMRATLVYGLLRMAELNKRDGAPTTLLDPMAGGGAIPIEVCVEIDSSQREALAGYKCVRKCARRSVGQS